MVKHNIRIFAFAILGLAFIVYAIIFALTQNFDSIDFQKAITHVSTTISINIIIWMIFIAWAWKWKIFYPWLVPFPNLSGNWEGTIKSNWKEKELDLDWDNTIPMLIANKAFQPGLGARPIKRFARTYF